MKRGAVFYLHSGFGGEGEEKREKEGGGGREALAAARPNSGAAVVSLRALGNRVRVADLHARTHPVLQGKSPGAVRAGAVALCLPFFWPLVICFFANVFKTCFDPLPGSSWSILTRTWKGRGRKQLG